MCNKLEQKCELCRTKIRVGEQYGVLVFNIESLEISSANPNGLITVHNSSTVDTMCLNCASKYDNESIKQLLD